MFGFLTHLFRNGTAPAWVRGACAIVGMAVFLVSSYGLMGWAAYRVLRWLF